MSRPLITVNTLLGQMRDGGKVMLPENAIITPAAQDWLQTARVSITRSAAAEPLQPKGPTLYVIGDAHCPTVATLLPQFERQYDKLDFRSCDGKLDCCLNHLCAVCKGLAECHQRRAVVLVPDGAVVAAVANRHAKVRAAIVNKPSKLPMLQRCLGPNLLVMETGEVAVRQIQALVADFFKGRPQTEECVAAALEAVCDENGPRQCFCRL